MFTLKADTLLQGGRYKIVKPLGQGGFGITYLGVQKGLDRKVAIKEFFIKDLCCRDESTSLVTLGTGAGRETVSRFRNKFLKEARYLAKLNHPNIVRVIDVFEENGTAYYVMEFAERGSLADKVKREGNLTESVATRYILQVAEALEYIHQQKINHLDVKPSNIMLNEKDECVLIDFGLSKQYDAETGGQTSTTPVGYSDGYAPIEQYQQGGVGEFSPQTDIYALGATFFKLLTGDNPPSASVVYEDGVPINKLKAKGVSENAIALVCKSLESRKKFRLSSARSFIDILNGSRQVPEVEQPKDGNDETIIIGGNTPTVRIDAPKPTVHKKRYGILVAILTAIIVLVVVVLFSGLFTRIESRSFTVNGQLFDMILVKAGTFTMGDDFELTDSDTYEKPAHQVTLTKDFYIGKTEVTQALWEAVMGVNPSRNVGPNNPVDNVSWDDCQEFIARLNNITGEVFRLPTEAEWEFAARGGNKSSHTEFCGSKKIDDVAWYKDNSGSRTHPVALKSPNELGIYDMSGNVNEWCSDISGVYDNFHQTDPTGPNDDDSVIFRIHRGGNVHTKYSDCYLTSRDFNSPYISSQDNGLRLVLTK